MENENILHNPVLLNDVITYLGLKKGMVIADCTVGLGGHALQILKVVGDKGFLIGIDRDMEALKEARYVLQAVSDRFALFKANFRDMDAVLDNAKIRKVDGALFDLGVSSLQFDSPERGFSLRSNGPLDMRMDRAGGITASDIVNGCTKEEMASIFERFGEEHFASRVAKRIAEERRKRRIGSTAELADIVAGALPYNLRFRRIHPATKVFMALRIAVNRELENVEEGVKRIIPYLRKGARLCVISFHSMEDRIIKNEFKKFAESGLLKIITKKPIVPAADEIRENPRSRSAKMRVAERTG